MQRRHLRAREKTCGGETIVFKLLGVEHGNDPPRELDKPLEQRLLLQNQRYEGEIN